MHRTLLLVVSIATAPVLVECLPVTSSSPLGTTVAATPDPQVTGVWKGKPGTSASAAYVVFYPGRDGPQKIVLLTLPTANDEGGWMVFEARAATLGGNTYLDTREIEDNGRPPDAKQRHIPVLYTITGDGLLVLYLVDEAAARAAIARGALAGAVEPGEFGDVTITADPAALDAFFSGSAGRALFRRPLGTFRRVN